MSCNRFKRSCNNVHLETNIASLVFSYLDYNNKHKSESFKNNQSSKKMKRSKQHKSIFEMNKKSIELEIDITKLSPRNEWYRKISKLSIPIGYRQKLQTIRKECYKKLKHVKVEEQVDIKMEEMEEPTHLVKLEQFEIVKVEEEELPIQPISQYEIIQYPIIDNVKEMEDVIITNNEMEIIKQNSYIDEKTEFNIKRSIFAQILDDGNVSKLEPVNGHWRNVIDNQLRSEINKLELREFLSFKYVAMSVIEYNSENLFDDGYWSRVINQQMTFKYIPIDYKMKLNELRQYFLSQREKKDVEMIEQSINEKIENSIKQDQSNDNINSEKVENNNQKLILYTQELQFPEIENVDSMELVLSRFIIDDEDKSKESAQEYMKFYNVFSQISVTEFQQLEDDTYWSALTNKLTNQYLPVDYKTKLNEYRQLVLKDKKQQQIDREIFENTPTLLDTVTDKTLNLIKYWSSNDNNKRPRDPDSDIEYENREKRQRILRDISKVSKKRPILVKQGFNNIIDDSILDISNIIEQYQKTLKSTLNDHFKEFKQIRELIQNKYKEIPDHRKRIFLDLLYDYWVLNKDDSYLQSKYKSETLIEDVKIVVERFENILFL